MLKHTKASLTLLHHVNWKKNHIDRFVVLARRKPEAWKKNHFIASEMSNWQGVLCTHEVKGWAPSTANRHTAWVYIQYITGVYVCTLYSTLLVYTYVLYTVHYWCIYMYFILKLLVYVYFNLLPSGCLWEGCTRRVFSSATVGHYILYCITHRTTHAQLLQRSPQRGDAVLLNVSLVVPLGLLPAPLHARDLHLGQHVKQVVVVLCPVGEGNTTLCFRLVWEFRSCTYVRTYDGIWWHALWHTVTVSLWCPVLRGGNTLWLRHCDIDRLLLWSVMW